MCLRETTRKARPVVEIIRNYLWHYGYYVEQEHVHCKKWRLQCPQNYCGHHYSQATGSSFVPSGRKGAVTRCHRGANAYYPLESTHSGTDRLTDWLTDQRKNAATILLYQLITRTCSIKPFLGGLWGCESDNPQIETSAFRLMTIRTWISWVACSYATPL